MELFNFSDFEDKYLEYRIRNFKFTYKLVAFVLLLFIFLFIYRYKYERFWPLFLTLYLFSLTSYPILYKITKNLFKSILVFFIIVTISISVLIFMAGGMKAPGLVWMTYMPTLGGGLLGRRGFLWGVLIIFSFLFLFSILSFLQIEMFPFSSHETFLSQMKLNLVLFAIATFYFADTHTRSEQNFVKNLQDEKMKNETLLRVLFHDLANPMQTIRLMLRKMKKVEERSNLEKNVELLDRTSLRIVEILENVRKMKAVEDHKFLFNKEIHSISDSINKAVELFEKQIVEKNIKVEINPTRSPDFKLVIDQTIFSFQILGNLISNSIKFSKSDGKIRICWWKEFDEQEEAMLHITIEDRGIGIPEDILKNIFELQGQVSRRGTNGEMGTGYGMPLVKAFVTEFNGTILINSPIPLPDGHTINGTQYLLTFKLAE